jgi:hypothetical protein
MNAAAAWRMMAEKMKKRLVCSLVVAASCGVADHQAASPSSAQGRLGPDGSGASDSRHLTPGQQKLGHFATRDGMIGLVLDRTGQPPKLRMDGEQAVVELSIEEDRNGTMRAGWIFRAPDGHAVLYLSAEGNFKIFTPTDIWGIELTNDREADPLPRATVRLSTTTAPETDPGISAFVTLSVRKHFPQFKPEDSANLAKVAEALALATPDMFVHLTVAGVQGARWAPASNHLKDEVRGQSGAFAGLQPASDAWDKTRPGLARYGISLERAPLRFGAPSRLETHALRGWPPALAAQTPGIIWETDPALVFVSVDGGRYELDKDLAALENGWPPIASWPPPLQHAALDLGSITLLASDGAVTEQVRRELDVLADAWADCVSDAWRTTKPKIDALGVDIADVRAQNIVHGAEQSAATRCGSLIKQCEVGLVRVIESRNTERLAILDKARLRAK